jgi:hypothetical protein
VAEYALIVGVIAVGAILALSAFGLISTGLFWDPIAQAFQDIVDLITP